MAIRGREKKNPALRGFELVGRVQKGGQGR